MPTDETVPDLGPVCIELAFASGELEVRSALSQLKRGSGADAAERGG